MLTQAERQQAEINIHKALSHPLRHKILRRCNEGVVSPNVFAKEQGLELNDVAFHFRRLVKLDCIELVDTRQVRGATEHFYRATRRTLVSTEDWEDMPPEAKGPACDGFMQAIVDDYAESRKAGVVSEDKHFHITRTSMTVDAEGRDRILSELERVMRMAEDESAASLTRLRESGEEPVPMSLGFATFCMPPSTG